MGKYAAGGELKPPTTGEGLTMYIPPQVNLERKKNILTSIEDHNGL